MITIPAFVWRWGPVGRALITGAAVGFGLGVLAWVDSGLLAAGLSVFVVVGVGYGVWTSRRMRRFWPAAAQLCGSDRVAVVRAVRSGHPISEARLAPSATEYCDGLHAAAAATGPVRWLLPAVLVVALAAAFWDSMFGSWGNLVVSAVYLGLLGVEVWWWPRHRDRLLANADQACRPQA